LLSVLVVQVLQVVDHVVARHLLVLYTLLAAQEAVLTTLLVQQALMAQAVVEAVRLTEAGHLQEEQVAHLFILLVALVVLLLVVIVPQ
jgi:hypothetical protein